MSQVCQVSKTCEALASHTVGKENVLTQFLFLTLTWKFIESDSIGNPSNESSNENKAKRGKHEGPKVDVRQTCNQTLTLPKVLEHVGMCAGGSNSCSSVVSECELMMIAEAFPLSAMFLSPLSRMKPEKKRAVFADLAALQGLMLSVKCARHTRDT